MDQLNSLPYLENVVREVLRLYPAEPHTLRIATEDVVIPVSEPYLDRKGSKRSEIRMAKGNPILIPILALNRLESIWGSDAHEFNPDRWNSLSLIIKSMPGLYANMLTFLAGTRACIGYRFALVEFKAILSTLLRAFEFQLAVPAEEIRSETHVANLPFEK